MKAYRLNYDSIKKGYDFVFIARNPIKDKNYTEVEECYEKFI